LTASFFYIFSTFETSSIFAYNRGQATIISQMGRQAEVSTLAAFLKKSMWFIENLLKQIKKRKAEFKKM
jgi:hypothetical protein